MTMDNAAHTPGPWTIEEYGDDDALALVIHKDSETRVCFMATPGSHGDPAKIAADARLIAAAPDMLAALKSLVADVLEYERINNLAPNPGRQDCWQSVTNARAVIAKAEGATP